MRGRILVVDADPLGRAAIGTPLTTEGHDVAEVGDAEAAVDRLKSGDVDVVVASAADAAAITAADGADTELIVIAVGDTLPPGATDFVRKPVQPAEVSARVGAALRLVRARRDLAAARHDAQEAARTDQLTGLANRRHLDEHLHMSSSAARRHRSAFSLLVVDVDHFRRVNDAEGHAGGDDVLRAVTARIAQVLRGEDMAGRWGGEEFLVVAPSTDLDGAWRLGERIREAVARTPVPLASGKDVLVTVSVGCATGEGDDIDHQLRRAEAALERAKELGRNRVCTDADVTA